MLKDKLEVSNEIHASGPFSDIRAGTYNGTKVAVKTLRVSRRDDPNNIRKVRKRGWSPRLASSLIHSVPGIFQTGHSLELFIPPQRLGASRCSVGHEQGTIHHCLKVDGMWQHNGLH